MLDCAIFGPPHSQVPIRRPQAARCAATSSLLILLLPLLLMPSNLGSVVHGVKGKSQEPRKLYILYIPESRQYC